MRGEWRGEEVALCLIAVDCGELVTLRSGFDALAYDYHPERVRHRGDGGNDLTLARLAAKLGDEAAVDLEDLRANVLELPRRPSDAGKVRHWAPAILGGWP